MLIVYSLFLGLSPINLWCMNPGDENPKTPPRFLPAASSETPLTVALPAINYCKNLLQAIQTGDDVALASSFERFFTKNPYTLHNINGHNESLYKALAVVLCLCIEQCSNATFENKMSYLECTSDDVVYLPLQYKDHIYVLQFFVSEEGADPHYYCYRFADTSATITVISINTILVDGKFDGIKIRRLDNRGYHVTEILDPLILPDSGGILYNETHMFKEAIASIDEPATLDGVLMYFFNAIPLVWHIPREKFYQVLFANALTFMGLGFVRTEVPTWDGRADFILHRHRDIPIIFEFKFEHTPEEALEQIKSRQYVTVTDAEAELVGTNITVESWSCDVQSCYEHYIPAPARLLKATPPGQPSQGYRRRGNSSRVTRRLLT
jgi:hypothetical protein